MRTKHGLIDFEDVYVEPNVWRQLGLSRRWLDGAVRQQCAGHLPFERQATANGSFTIRPTGTTDPEPTNAAKQSGHSPREYDTAGLSPPPTTLGRNSGQEVPSYTICPCPPIQS